MEEGSFSVEAAIVMPVIIFAVLSLLFFGFFLRDVILVETTGRSLLIERSRYGFYEDLEDIAERENEVKQLLAECLWWSELTKFDVSEEADYIEYVVSTNLFGFRTAMENIIVTTEYFDTTEKLWMWKSITEEAEELFFMGGNKDGG